MLKIVVVKLFKRGVHAYMKTIWTNGCFDILHVGHMRLLKYAKSLGSVLVVGIDSDNRVQKLKSGRPVNSHNFRKEMLMGIRWVDHVVIFDSEQELKNLIKAYANLIVVGSDYKHKKVIGSEYSDVVFFDRVDGHSTTNILTQ